MDVVFGSRSEVSTMSSYQEIRTDLISDRLRTAKVTVENGGKLSSSAATFQTHPLSRQ
jgi:hypothetical protein